MGRLLSRLCSGCLLLIAVEFAMHIGALVACETPVYRYAMYRWQPAPYEVYFFHDEAPGELDQRVRERLNEFERGGESRANVAYIPVNLDEDPELASVPPDVKKAWLGRDDKKLPAYFISTPYGVGIGFEQLDEVKVNLLIESPFRKSLAAQLETGKLGVFVMLSGKDAAETQATEAILAGLVEEVQQGKVSLYVSPAKGATENAPSPVKPDFDLGFIKLDRDDQEEQWFVRTLLAMEPDLAAEERPMVFLVYGRARALLPYIGKGITRENLIREIEFISGACSCTVKEQNPGVDLLVRYDWEAAAAALADKFGNEEGNESQFGPEMFFPELIIPESTPPAETQLASNDIEKSIVTDDATLERTPEDASAETSLTAIDDEIVAEHPNAETSNDSDLIDPELTASPTGPEVATVVPTPDKPKLDVDALTTTSTTTSVWIVGVGIGIVLVVLFGLTFVVLRPR